MSNKNLTEQEKIRKVLSLLIFLKTERTAVEISKYLNKTLNLVKMKLNGIQLAYHFDEILDTIIAEYTAIEEISFSFFDDNGDEAEGIKLLLCADADNTLQFLCEKYKVKIIKVIVVSDKNKIPKNRLFTGWNSQYKFIYKQTNYDKNKDKILSYHRKYAENNREKTKAINNKYRENNLSILNERQREKRKINKNYLIQNRHYFQTRVILSELTKTYKRTNKQTRKDELQSKISFLNSLNLKSMLKSEFEIKYIEYLKQK